MRKDVAEKGKLTSLADLSRYLKEKGDFKLAASAEFIERPDALPAFEKAYAFKLDQAQLLSLAGGDTAVTIKAAAQQTSGVNAAMAYGTDGPVAALGLQTLPIQKASSRFTPRHLSCGKRYLKRTRILLNGSNRSSKSWMQKRCNS